MNFDDIFRIAPARTGKHRPAGKSAEQLNISLKFPGSPDGDPRRRRTHTGTDSWGREIYWAYTTERNADGFFIGFRQVFDPKTKTGFRDSWRARKARWRVKDWARDQFNRSPHRKTDWTYPLKRDRK